MCGPKPSCLKWRRLGSSGRPTAKPVLYEFAIDGSHLRRLAGANWIEAKTLADTLGNFAQAFAAGGYDYAYLPWGAPLMHFPLSLRDRDRSMSMAHGGLVTTREEFDNYPGPTPTPTTGRSSTAPDRASPRA